MLRVVRKIYSDTTTIGDLYFKENFICYSLEDTVRKLKIPHMTAIPNGQYEIIMSFSNRFQKKLPELLSVPFFSGIRIHAGNTDKDTDGCILVGETVGKDFVGNSKKALDRLIPMIEEELKVGKLYIHVSGGYDADQWEEMFVGKNA